MKKGFTLIEIIITFTIFALLSSMGLIAWRKQVNQARDTQKKEDLQKISIALEEYYNDNDCYPPADILDNCGGDELAPYLASIPCDPLVSQPYCYIPDPDHPDCPTCFRLLTVLKNQSDPIITKLGCHGPEFCGYEDDCAIPTEDLAGFNYGISSSNVSVLNPDVTPPSASAAPGDGGTGVYDGDFACNPDGVCNIYQDPLGAGCPGTYYDPDICQAACANPANRCTEEPN